MLRDRLAALIVCLCVFGVACEATREITDSVLSFDWLPWADDADAGPDAATDASADAGPDAAPADAALPEPIIDSGPPPVVDAGVPPPLVPDFGPSDAPLIAGWERLEPGMTAKDLLKLRPLARASPVGDMVYTEPLNHPWMAVSYRFHRDRGHLTEIRWIPADPIQGEQAFEEMKERGMRRWQVRPKLSTLESSQIALWDLKEGRIELTLEGEDQRLRISWYPKERARKKRPKKKPTGKRKKKKR